MKLIRTTLAFALAVASAVIGAALFAQVGVPPTVEGKARPEVISAQPALWKVSDADTTIYLFGTIHLLPEGIEWYDGAIATAFEAADELVTEIPDLPQDQTMALSQRMGALPQGQTLREQMSEDERAKFENALQELKIPVAAMDGFKPWLASVAITTVPLMQAGYNLENGVEAQLDKRNKALGRPRSGLETLEYQLGIFDTLSTEVQKAYLFETIESLPSMPQEVDKMVAIWSRGDAGELAALLNDTLINPVLYKALLTDRNRSWAAWIDDRLDRRGTVFIAVGAGHLGGRDSVQDFLGKAGIKVVRVQ